MKFLEEYPNYLGTGAVHGWALIHTSNFSKEAVLEQLQNKNTSILYHPKGVISSRYLALQPLYFLGKSISNYFVISDSFNYVGSIIFFSYYIGIFVLIEVMVFFERKLTAKLDKRSKGKSKMD
ncbi:MAG: hypothetical protein ACTSQF_12970 [Candidatus Heimdallarchaeaceae archaeon]